MKKNITNSIKATTVNYELVKPSQDDFYNVDDFNQNMDIIDGQLKNNDSRIYDVEEKIRNIDVSSDVRQVINERVNTDTSKPLSTLISEWINQAKSAILSGIESLKSHVTSKVDALPQKSIWTDARGTKLDNLDQSLTTTQNNMNRTMQTVRDEVKNHITSALANPKVVKNVQRGWIANDDTSYIENKYSKDYTISPVNQKKTMINLYSASDGIQPCARLMSSTVLRIYANSPRNIIDVSWEVIEFY